MLLPYDEVFPPEVAPEDEAFLGFTCCTVDDGEGERIWQDTDSHFNQQTVSDFTRIFMIKIHAWDTEMSIPLAQDEEEKQQEPELHIYTAAYHKCTPRLELSVVE